jgi:hypothetical protein
MCSSPCVALQTRPETNDNHSDKPVVFAYCCFYETMTEAAMEWQLGKGIAARSNFTAINVTPGQMSHSTLALIPCPAVC